MILTTEQAAEVSAQMTGTAKISIDMRVPGTYSERVKVVHEPKNSSKVLVWQTVGGVAHNSEAYSSRESFKEAYGV